MPLRYEMYDSSGDLMIEIEIRDLEVIGDIDLRLTVSLDKKELLKIAESIRENA